jgi:hypothetical protein
MVNFSPLKNIIIGIRENCMFKSTLLCAILLFLTIQIRAQSRNDSILVKSISVDSSNFKTKNSSSDTINLVNRFRSLEHKRQQLFDFDSVPDFNNPFFIEASELYRKNATHMPDALRYHPMFTEIKYNLASSLNRMLPYGTVAPVNFYYGSSSLRFERALFPLSLQNTYSTEINTVSITNKGIHLDDYTVATALPEIVILWENGVFGENILDVRFTRPFTRNIMLSVFSNFRHFDGKKFSHSSNNIYELYSNLYKDTTEAVNTGYNIQTEEHCSGLQLSYLGVRNTAFFKLKYADLLSEAAIDTFSSTNDQMYEMYRRFPLEITLDASHHTNNQFFFDSKLGYQTQPVIRTQPSIVSNTGKSIRNDASAGIFNLGLQGGKKILTDDSLFITIDMQNINQTLYNRVDTSLLSAESRISYNHNQGDSSKGLGLTFNGGANTHVLDDDIDINPILYAGCNIRSKHNDIRAYAKHDVIPVATPLDTLDTISDYSVSYSQAGAEYFFHTDKFRILLGYQYLTDIDDNTINNSWIEGVAPYSQPASSFIIAPSLGRFHGAALNASFCISDQKPYIKSNSRLSYIIHPMSTSEYIDISLGAEYWSEREPIVFAGRNDWNKSFVNVDLAVSVHILGFRLFYKVDNILNRKYAYIPGYYSPGLTFRWGFNWFIQR